jgi:bisphosphoglycerate-dependent phosphoglycerate mutase
VINRCTSTSLTSLFYAEKEGRHSHTAYSSYTTEHAMCSRDSYTVDSTAATTVLSCSDHHEIRCATATAATIARTSTLELELEVVVTEPLLTHTHTLANSTTAAAAAVATTATAAEQMISGKTMTY